MLELEPTAAPKASCWEYMCGHSTRQRDGGTSYEAPPQSPGSRHAFASRFSGPRSLGTGTSKLMSPGCLSDDYETTAPHYGCKSAARCLGDQVNDAGESPPSSPGNEARLASSSFLAEELSPPQAHVCSPQRPRAERDAHTPLATLRQSWDALTIDEEASSPMAVSAEKTDTSTTHKVDDGNRNSFAHSAFQSSRGEANLQDLNGHTNPQRMEPAESMSPMLTAFNGARRHPAAEAEQCNPHNLPVTTHPGPSLRPRARDQQHTSARGP